MDTKKKKLTAIIIAAVALVLAAVIVVTCVVLRRSDGTSPDTLGGSGQNLPTVTYKPEEGKTVTYEKADFGDYSIPAEFVEIMNAANAVSEKECSEKGVALTVGSHEISLTEFAMSYYDTYSNAVFEYGSDTQTTKALRSDVRPSELQYAGEVTWKERLEELTVEDVRKKYILAFEALRQGFDISNETYEFIVEEFKANVEYTESQGITLDDFMEASYCARVPYELYQRSYILMWYAAEYEEALKTQFSATYSEEDIENFYKDASFLYDYVDVYMMLINMGSTVDPSEYEHIRTKEEFLDFVHQYFTENGYPVEVIDEASNWTKCSYKDLGSAIGKDVADWCFDPAREAGDIEMVSGVVYECLIFVDRPAYKEVSADFLDCYLYHTYSNGSTDNEKIKNTNIAMAQIQQEFELTDKSAEAFKDIATKYSQGFAAADGGLNSAVRLSNDDEMYDKEALRWCFAEGRKSGDYACIETDLGYQLIYFLNKNEGDYDYVYGILKHFGENDFDEYLNELLEYKDNVTKIDKDNCAKGSDAGEEAAAQSVEQVIAAGY